jgi:hypothetical protein
MQREMKCKDFSFIEFYLREGEEIFFFLIQINTQCYGKFAKMPNYQINASEIPNNDKLFNACTKTLQL